MAARWRVRPAEFGDDRLLYSATLRSLKHLRHT